MSRNPYANQYANSSYNAASGMDYLGGAGTGALSGAAAGSAFGPYGTLIGGVVGAGAGLLGTKINDDKAKEAAKQQDALTRDLGSHDLMNRYMQQQGLSDALGRQSAVLGAQQAAARGNLTGGAAASLQNQTQNQIALQQSQARPGMFLAANQADLARRQQVLNEYQTAQALASEQQPFDMGQAFGALGQAGALYSTMKQGQQPAKQYHDGRRVAPDMTGQAQEALAGDTISPVPIENQTYSQWNDTLNNPWGMGYPAPVNQGTQVGLSSPQQWQYQQQAPWATGINAPMQGVTGGVTPPPEPAYNAPPTVPSLGGGGAPGMGVQRAPTPVSSPALGAPPAQPGAQPAIGSGRYAPDASGDPWGKFNADIRDSYAADLRSQAAMEESARATQEYVTTRVPGMDRDVQVPSGLAQAAANKDAEALLSWEDKPQDQTIVSNGLTSAQLNQFNDSSYALVYGADALRQFKLANGIP